jgi:transposase
MRNCIGIDVAKKQFDMHLLKQNKDMQLSNDADGISKCVQLCRESKPELIVMEATGGYERLLAGHLQAEGFAVAVVASMRKLLCIMNTMLKNNQKWQPNFVKIS